MRCRVCGTHTGYSRMSGRLVTWCSEECADTPNTKYPDTIERDEIACELFLAGMTMVALANELGISRQLLAHVLQRRGIFTSEREARIA